MLVLSQLSMCLIEYVNRKGEHFEKDFSHDVTKQ
jgi:hypothetical protein